MLVFLRVKPQGRGGPWGRKRATRQKLSMETNWFFCCLTFDLNLGRNLRAAASSHFLIGSSVSFQTSWAFFSEWTAFFWQLWYRKGWSLDIDLLMPLLGIFPAWNLHVTHGLVFMWLLISLHLSDVSHRQHSQFYFCFIWLSGLLTPNSLWKIGGSWGEILLSSNLGQSTSWQLHELGHFEPRLKKLSIEVPMTGTDEWSSIEASLAIKFWPIVDFPSLWGETFTSISFLSYTCLKNPVYLQS